jgi:phosphonate transport system permease protein
MVETIFIAFIATALSLPLSFLAGFVSARNLMKGSPASMVVYTIVRFILNFTRSVEPMIWAIIFSVWVGIGPYAGMLALMLHSIASLAKNYSEQVECIEQGPVEAIEATGANRLQVIWFAVVPQIVLPFLAFTIYRWDINVRMATIIGLVGGGGIGTLLMQYQGLARWNEVGTIIITIAAVVWIMDYLSAKIREAIY